MKRFVIFNIFFFILITSSFSHYSNADFNFSYSKFKISSDNIDFNSNNIGGCIQWSFYFGENAFLGTCINAGYYPSIKNNCNTSIKSLSFDNSLNNYESGLLDLSIGLVARQNIHKLYFNECLLFDLLVYDGLYSNFIDNRDFHLFSVSYAPKIALSSYYNLFSTFYLIISCSFSYGWSDNKTFIKYTEKDSKKTSDYTTHTHGSVSNFCFMLGLGFFSF